MRSETFKKLVEEVKERQRHDTLSYNQRVALEQQIFKDLPQVCVKCGRKDRLTLDHIVPRQVLLSFGIDTEREIIEDNYSILCSICNHMKSNRLDLTNPKTKEILLRLLEKF